MRPASLLSRVALAASALLVIGCSDSSGSGALPTDAADGLYPQISATSSGAVTLRLLQRPGGILLGSYQGELRYDPAALAVTGAELPAGVLGSVSLGEPGRVRFVGTTLDGVDGDAPLLQLTLRRGSTVSRESFSVQMEEVTSAADFADLTAQVYSGPVLFHGGN